MRVLALDTALGATSVAVYDSETSRVLAEGSEAMARGHAEALLPMVDRVLKETGLGFSQIDRYASTIGPGSFTGIRIGIAAARAFALAHRKPVVGVSTLAAFAAPVLFGGEKRAVAAAVDARHGMVFYQLTSAEGSVMAGPGLFSLADAARGIGSAPVICAGDAAEMLARAVKEQNPDWRITPDTVRASAAPVISWVARLASVADPLVSACKPLYLREANVTMQDSHRLQRVATAGA
ncbi:MAG: tRNA (adenosine(37)-N6)-threonylcarbamoyltransferase complex dimerization subunit type 1 TsaB [Beijerinckiaceae bacterium]|jgi:tRNA threonylcarbamoyladenosine biosynthesis protein TsaB|nr:tRNA (adenosine(37)-N6)-threonylcarbamoyltransferase complex dimerization subunit type 1 TsaB [Beijerinckiaceae bacterium]